MIFQDKCLPSNIKKNFDTISTLSFDFTAGACSASDNRVMLCFPNQNKKHCYKSRSPVPEHWWQFTMTRKSFFEHNFTAIALSSFNTSGFFVLRIKD